MIASYPWYIQDWLLSRARAILTIEQRGLFREVLDVLYNNQGLLDNEEDMIRRLCGAERAEWKRSWPAVRKLLDEVSGKLSHPKVRDTIGKMEVHRAMKQKAGKAAADARWGNADPVSENKQTDNRRIPDAPVCYDPAITENARSDTYRSDTLRSDTLRSEPAIDLNDEFDRAWKRWPAKGRTRRPLCETNWTEVFLTVREEDYGEMIAAIHEGIDRWLVSALFAKGFVHGFADFLAQRRWAEEPEPDARSIPAEPIMRNAADVLRELRALSNGEGD